MGNFSAKCGITGLTIEAFKNESVVGMVYERDDATMFHRVIPYYFTGNYSGYGGIDLHEKFKGPSVLSKTYSPIWQEYYTDQVVGMASSMREDDQDFRHGINLGLLLFHREAFYNAVKLAKELNINPYPRSSIYAYFDFSCDIKKGEWANIEKALSVIALVMRMGEFVYGNAPQMPYREYETLRAEMTFEIARKKGKK